MFSHFSIDLVIDRLGSAYPALMDSDINLFTI